MLLTRTKLSSFTPFSLSKMSGVTLLIYQAPTSQVFPKLYALALQPPSSEVVSSKLPYHFPNSSCLPHKSHLSCPCPGRCPLVLTSSRDLSNETSETKCAAPSGRRQGLLRRSLRTTATSTICWQVALLWDSLLPPAGCLARPGNCRMSKQFFLLRGVRQRNSLPGYRY